MKKVFFSCLIALFLASCGASSRSASRQSASDTTSVSYSAVIDSAVRKSEKSGFWYKDWEVIMERTIYGSDSGSCGKVAETRKLRLTSREVSEEKKTEDEFVVKNILKTDSVNSHMSSLQNEEKRNEGIASSWNLLWILFVLLLAGVFVRILKS